MTYYWSAIRIRRIKKSTFTSDEKLDRPKVKKTMPKLNGDSPQFPIPHLRYSTFPLLTLFSDPKLGYCIIVF